MAVYTPPSLRRRNLLFTQISFACGLLSTAEVVAAPRPNVDSLEEIVVTARRTSESLQDVPASVSVLTEDSLDAAGVNSVERIIGLTPGVSIVTNTTEVGDTQINIRGINGARDAENNVALVVDGILKTNTAQVAQTQGKLIQTELLKGPQGAYYGRNAAAGAIVLTTAKPGDSYSGDIKVMTGENNTHGATLQLDGPLTANSGMNLFAEYRESDGFYRNTGPTESSRGATVDPSENLTLGARYVIYPTETSEIDIKARYADYSGAALGFNPAFHLPTFASVLGNDLYYEDVNDHNYEFVGNVTPKSNQETNEFSIKGSWDFDSVQLTAWTLYSDIDQEWIADSTAATFYRFEMTDACRASATALADAGYQLPEPQVLSATPYASVYGPFGPTTCDGTQYQARSQTDVSAEVRLASLGDGPLGWSLGAYYMQMDRDTSVSIAEDTGSTPIMSAYNPPSSTNPTSLMFSDTFDTQVYAAFGSLDYALTDNLELSLALRYDVEEREVSSNVPNVTDPATGEPINPGLPETGSIPDAEENYDQWQPKVSLAWAVSPDWSVFTNWGIGFKAGGFNSQGSEATIEQNLNIPLDAGLNIEDTYNKEVSRSAELGTKGTILEGGTTLELVGYYTEITDMQFFEFFTGPFGLLRVVSNIDKVEIYGLEGSLYSRLPMGFDVFGSFSMNHSEIIENSSRQGTEGNKSPYTAQYTVNLGALWSGEVTDTLSLTTRLDWRLTGPTWFHTVQDEEVRTIFDLYYPGMGTADYSKTQRNAYATVDLRMELSSVQGWHLAAFGTNIFDKEYVAEVIPTAEFGGSFVAPGQGRLLGIEVGYDF